MIKETTDRVNKYVAYLRSLIEDPELLSDEELLEKFRHCFCCEEEILSKSEQLHTILEFDTPKRAHKRMYENLQNEEN